MVLLPAFVFFLAATPVPVQVQHLPAVEVADSPWVIFGAIASALVALATGLLAYFTYRLAVDAVRAESADYRASQRVKEALADLAAALLVILRRCTVYIANGREKKRYQLTPVPNFQDDLDLQAEFRHVAEFSLGVVGIALATWIALIQPEINASRRPKGWRTFFMMLDAVRDTETATQCAGQVIDILRLISSLAPSDIRRISETVGNIENALGSIGNILRSDVLLEAAMSMRPEAEDQRQEDMEMMLFLKDTCNIEDPDLDILIASATGNTELMQRALDAGANPSINRGTLRSRYADRLTGFPKSGKHW